MMWTVASPETWMGDAEQQSVPDEIVCRGGVWMSVVRDEAGGYRIKRVLSTDPNDYLCTDITPGMILR